MTGALVPGAFVAGSFDPPLPEPAAACAARALDRPCWAAESLSWAAASCCSAAAVCWRARTQVVRSAGAEDAEATACTSDAALTRSAAPVRAAPCSAAVDEVVVVGVAVVGVPETGWRRGGRGRRRGGGRGCGGRSRRGGRRGSRERARACLLLRRQQRGHGVEVGGSGLRGGRRGLLRALDPRAGRRRTARAGPEVLVAGAERVVVAGRKGLPGGCSLPARRRHPRGRCCSTVPPRSRRKWSPRWRTGRTRGSLWRGPGSPRPR